MKIDVFLYMQNKTLELSNVLFLVAEARLERTTSRLWAWRATNCSTPRYNVAHRLFPNCDCKGSYFFFILQIFEEKNAKSYAIFSQTWPGRLNFYLPESLRDTPEVGTDACHLTPWWEWVDRKGGALEVRLSRLQHRGRCGTVRPHW